MTANTDVHTCSYYCERPECVRLQRAELRDRMESALAALQAENERLREEVVKLRNIRADAVHAAALANIRAELLAGALALLPDEIDMVEHNPDEGPRMFCCGEKVITLSCNRGLILTHNEGCWYERMRALRDHDQEGSND